MVQPHSPFVGGVHGVAEVHPPLEVAGGARLQAPGPETPRSVRRCCRTPRRAATARPRNRHATVVTPTGGERQRPATGETRRRDQGENRSPRRVARHHRDPTSAAELNPVCGLSPVIGYRRSKSALAARPASEGALPPDSRRQHEEDPRHQDQGRARAQPQEHRRRDPARQAGGDHGAVGFGEVVAGVRHASTPRGSAATSSRCRPTRASSSTRCTSPTSTRSRGCRRRSRSSRRPGSRNPRSTVGHGHRDLRLPAAALGARRDRSTAGTAASRSPRRPSSRWSIGCWSCPRGRASRCWRRWCATRRASSPTCWPSCARTASCAPTSTASSTSWPSRPSWTRTRRTPSRCSSIGW